jgi:chemotaxis protein methyltransferase CheR
MLEVHDHEIKLFIDTLKLNSTYDFSRYTEKSFRRRVEKVVNDNRLATPDLIKKMTKNKDFLEKTVRDITVNTTELFRDTDIWLAIKEKIIPAFKEKEMINIWHAGCSSGQEVYSMLILLNEFDLMKKTIVLGTDLNTDVLEEAKKGTYKFNFNKNYVDNFNTVFNPNDEIKVPFEKYFDINKSKDTMTIKPILSGKAMFRKHDLVTEPNKFDTQFDLIICRNVLIYFNNDLQNNVFDLFHKSLNNNGTLLIGLHESILGVFANKFDKKGVFYLKK